MTRLYLLIWVCIFTLPAFAQEGRKLTDTNEFYSQMQKAAQSFSSITSDFKQLKHLDVFNETIESNGRFYYKDGTMVCLDYLKPTRYKIVINGNRIMTETNGKKNIVTLKTNKLMAEMQNMLTASMSGDLSKLSGYSLEVYDHVSTYTVYVKPENKSLLAYISGFEITIDKKDFSVSKLRIKETGDNYTDYLFSNQQFNTLKDEAMFSFD